jgi:hypothetical protein
MKSGGQARTDEGGAPAERERRPPKKRHAKKRTHLPLDAELPQRDALEALALRIRQWINNREHPRATLRDGRC